MTKQTKCPSPIDVMSWLDKETNEQCIGEHLQECLDCQLLVNTLQHENRLLKSIFEAWPTMPDISTNIMLRIEKTTRNLNPLEAAGAYILIISTSLLLLVLYNYLFLPYFALTSPWSVTAVKTISLLTDALLYFKQLVLYLLNIALSSEPLLPSATVTLSVILINIYYKRRLSNV
ncbi:MAG: hypothetical protein CVU87_12330 [Firmicutes bacterium HGW-Firmicutes-12]|nr:MAG: hypothetical protein CVU87_12330 [Firmicutes bacterium HGW-Firmicutes-12]